MTNPACYCICINRYFFGGCHESCICTINHSMDLHRFIFTAANKRYCQTSKKYGKKSHYRQYSYQHYRKFF